MLEQHCSDFQMYNHMLLALKLSDMTKTCNKFVVAWLYSNYATVHNRLEYTLNLDIGNLGASLLPKIGEPQLSFGYFCRILPHIPGSPVEVNEP